MLTLAGRDQQSLQAAQQRLLAALSSQQFLTGNQPSLADIAVYTALFNVPQVCLTYRRGIICSHSNLQELWHSAADQLSQFALGFGCCIVARHPVRPCSSYDHQRASGAAVICAQAALAQPIQAFLDAVASLPEVQAGIQAATASQDAAPAPVVAQGSGKQSVHAVKPKRPIPGKPRPLMLQLFLSVLSGPEYVVLRVGPAGACRHAMPNADFSKVLYLLCKWAQ